MAQMMAMENDHIKADVVEVQEFPQVAQRYRVMGVPKTVINESTQFIGAVPEEVFMGKVLEAIGKAEAVPGHRGGSAVYVNLGRGDYNGSLYLHRLIEAGEGECPFEGDNLPSPAHVPSSQHHHGHVQKQSDHLIRLW